MSSYRQQFSGLKPQEITYNQADGVIIIRSSSLPVSDPKKAFIEALEEFPVTNTFENLNTGTKIHIDCIIGDEVNFGCNCTIGGAGFGYYPDENGYNKRMPHHGNVVIEDHVTIHNNVNIDRATTQSTIIGKHTAIDSNVHIGHNAIIGTNCLIAAGAVIGGSAKIGHSSFIGCNAFIKQKVVIGNNCVIGAGAVVTKDVPDNETWVGVPAKKIDITIN